MFNLCKPTKSPAIYLSPYIAADRCWLSFAINGSSIETPGDLLSKHSAISVGISLSATGLLPAPQLAVYIPRPAPQYSVRNS